MKFGIISHPTLGLIEVFPYWFNFKGFKKITFDEFDVMFKAGNGTVAPGYCAVINENDERYTLVGSPYLQAITIKNYINPDCWQAKIIGAIEVINHPISRIRMEITYFIPVMGLMNWIYWFLVNYKIVSSTEEERTELFFIRFGKYMDED